ncbi:cysteine hydrolase family protein [Roseobacter litoralis]|uniref:Isochorismatase family protein n=1 Tax=Roseobacter litoralis (strain ATCC 49566 / DSM 6996 / JCM 21268 / NBRC 15278 / OCh 149) TaxID=391595 RepID=F7ZLM8_ROSLO|nr:cysteine hydrolase [Roseobacter litoralis]AEI94079.1 putative isochorismatase family protein [Roseobacter litoralis Och 149]
MQRYELDPEFEARYEWTRGPTHLLEEADPKTTAHLVIDMQNGFLRPGALLETPPAREVVPQINAISSALRAAGGMVAFTRFAYDPTEKAWDAFYRRFLNPVRSSAQQEAFGPDAHDLQLWDGLDIDPSDLVVDKTRFSAFIMGTCDMHEILQERGIRTLIISGTMTNCCCDSTARDAMQYGYDVVFAADATGTVSKTEQDAAVLNMALLFAEVANTEDIVSAFTR